MEDHDEAGNCEVPYFQTNRSLDLSDVENELCIWDKRTSLGYLMPMNKGHWSMNLTTESTQVSPDILWTNSNSQKVVKKLHVLRQMVCMN